MSLRVGALACAAALGALPLPAAPPIPHYGHRAYRSADGLTNSSVRSLAQTPDGYVWIGTRAGLFRFDGQRFSRFGRIGTPAFVNDRIQVVDVAPDGSLWIGTGGGGLLVYRDGIFERVPLGEEPSDVIVWDLAFDANRVWVATSAGLFAVDSGRATRWEELGTTIIRSLALSSQHGLWIGTQERGLLQFHEGQLHEFGFAEPGTEVSGLATEKNGALWLTMRNRLHRWPKPFEGHPRPVTGLGPIQDLLDEDGVLWLTTPGGLVRIEDGERQIFGEAEGLTGDRATDLLRDREGNLWVGTLHGLDQLIPGDVRTFTTRDGVPGGAVWAVLETRDGQLWVGADGGLGRRAPGGRFELVDRLGLAGVWALAEGDDGSLWVGTGGSGLIHLTGGRREVYRVADGLPGDRIWALFSDSRGRLWIGADESGLGVLQDGRFTHVDLPVSPGARVWALQEDARGVVWVGTSHGLVGLSDGAAPRVYADDEMPSRLIWSIQPSGDALYLGTDDRGLLRLDATGTRSVSAADGLPHDVVVNVLSEPGGALWLTTPDGLLTGPRASFDALLDGRTPDVRLRFFDRPDGLRTGLSAGGSPAAWRDRSGGLWFGTNEGLAHIDPTRLREPAGVPPPIVETVEVDGVAIGEGGLAVPGRREVTAHFTTLLLMHPERVRFRYRLDGQDEDWVDAGTRRFANWSNLGPGEYEFRVAASDGGPWVESRAPFRFTLSPRFVETRLFLVVAGAGILLVAFGAHHYRVSALARDEAARAERQERLHHAQRLESLGRLASGVAHDFNNLLLVISLEAESLESHPELPAEVRQCLERVRVAQEHAATLVRRLLEVARRRESAPQVVDLAHLVEDLTDLLPRIIGGQVRLRRHIRTRPIWVSVDPAQIERALMNLVVNARDAMPSRGGHIDVEVAVEDERALLSVRDDGEGIAPEVAERIFEPFFSTKDPDRGTGLGLATVRSVVEECGGSIDVESAPGRGARFRITLPLAAGPGEAHRAPAVAD